MISLDSNEDSDSHLYTSTQKIDTLILNDHLPQYQPSSTSAVFLSPPSSSSTTTIATVDPQNPNSSLSSHLDPASYADSESPSFDFHTPVYLHNTHDRVASSSHGSSLSSTEFDFISVSVSDPLKVLEASSSLVPGSGSYYTYLITTRTNSKEFSVRRRFREVVTLSDRLAEGYRGFFVPLRPDKSIMESQIMQNNEFVEQRRVAIEKYLRKLAGHPAIRKSDELGVFLQVEGKLPLAKTTDIASRLLDGVVKLPEEEVVQQQVPKGGMDLMRLFKELRQAVANDWGGTKPSFVEEDKEFLEKKGRLSDLEHQLSNMCEQAEGLVKAQQDIGETMGELGLTFVKLTKLEAEEAVYDCQRTSASDMKNVSTSAVKVSRLYGELNAQTVKHLDKLHDYLGMMLSIDNAFTDRSNALLTVQTLVAELSSLQSKTDKLELASSKVFGGDRSRVRKIEELKETLKVTEEARCCAVREYERIKENNRSELERVDRERRKDFLSMLKGFVVNQAECAEKIADVWEKVADKTSGYAKDVC